ncbi:MAG: glutathione S-transferase family protein, partial [Cucumibacter sp.]
MKLYILDVSNTSRPVRVLIAENNLPVEIVSLDFYKGEHAKPPYTDINPNALVPTLDDDGFMLTESSAIMKYLADKFDLPLYPKGLRERAQVNEMMDWFNTQFYRDYAYNVVCPQIYAH